MALVRRGHAQSDILLVSNVQAEQCDGEAVVDVTYDLQTVGGEPVLICVPATGPVLTAGRSRANRLGTAIRVS